MIDFAKLESDFGAMNGRVRYLLGSKAGLFAQPAAIKTIDCSGLTRYLLYRCTGVLWPDGSTNQLDFARKHLRELDRYSDVEYAKDDDRLFIAFKVPNALQRALNRRDGRARGRHVWLVHRGRTLESYGGHGVGRRHWKALKADFCFEVK